MPIEVVEASVRDLGPYGSVCPSRAEIADRPLMADALYGLGHFGVGRDEPLEILLLDFQEACIFDGADRSGGWLPAEQGHFAKRVPLAEDRVGAAGSFVFKSGVRQKLDSSAGD